MLVQSQEAVVKEHFPKVFKVQGWGTKPEGQSAALWISSTGVQRQVGGVLVWVSYPKGCIVQGSQKQGRGIVP